MSGSKRYWPIALLGGSIGLGAIGGWWRHHSSGSVAPPTVTSVAVPRVEIPTFGQPEEARRFFDAAIAGDRRAIELLDASLAEAKKVGSADPAYVSSITEERAMRGARLTAYETARRTLKASSR